MLSKKLMWVALVVYLLAGQVALGKTKRLVVDITYNHYPALNEFLIGQGYWEEEIAAVLEPLGETLSSSHGTPDAHLVQNMDDIPGLRPLPEGVTNFLHGRHNVFYVAVAADRLLVGISFLSSGDNDESKPSFQFEKFDLISGVSETIEDRAKRQAGFMEFLYAHDPYLGSTLSLLVSGTVVMFFLALRLRQRRGFNTDQVVRAHRLKADSRIFLVTGCSWVVMVAAVYGLMHFSARIHFMEVAAASQSLTFRLTNMLVLAPDRLRLLSFIFTASTAALTVILLGLWAGAFGGRRPDDGQPAGGDWS